MTTKIDILKNNLLDRAELKPEKKELEKLCFVQMKLKNKIKAVKKKRYWTIACTTAILVGMLLVFFPPAFIPYSGVIGSIIAFTSGSVFLGFGKRVYEYAFGRSGNIAGQPNP